MDIQYIWPGFTLGVLKGITNVGTVINWLGPCLLPSLLSLRCKATRLVQQRTLKSTLHTPSVYLHVPVHTCLAHAHAHASSSLIPVQRQPLGRRLRPPGERELSFSSCLRGNLPYAMNSALPGRRPWILSEKIKRREPGKNSEALLKASAKRKEFHTRWQMQFLQLDSDPFLL